MSSSTSQRQRQSNTFHSGIPQRVRNSRRTPCETSNHRHTILKYVSTRANGTQHASLSARETAFSTTAYPSTNSKHRVLRTVSDFLSKEAFRQTPRAPHTSDFLSKEAFRQ